MNLSKQGWLQRYLDFRTSTPFAEKLPSFGVKVLDDDSVHNSMDEAIYYFLQPTGLLYGLPNTPPFHGMDYPKSKYFSSHDWVLLTFLESIFGCMVADRHFLLDGLDDQEEDRLLPAAEVVQHYMMHPVNSNSPDNSGGSTLLNLGRRLLHQSEDIEGELLRRVRPAHARFAKPQLFSSCFLFLDLYGCILWQRRRLMGEDDSQAPDALYVEQDQQKFALLQLMIVAAWADGDVGSREGHLAEQLIKGSGLSEGRIQILQSKFKEGIKTDDVDIPEMPWLVRRYMLDLILMMVMVDQELKDSELEFVDSLVDRLGLWSQERDQSRAAMEIYLMNQHSKLKYKNWRPSLFSLGEQIRERASIAIRANLDKVVNEIKETQELYQLLMKATHETLTPEERQKVNNQLMDILKTIPALAIFALPGGGIALPILIRLLPFNILPSSFDD